MITYKYLIIGGGMTADAAVRGIRELDSSGSIGLISMESYPPYSRPPLSKGLWKGKSIDNIWRKTDTFNVDFHLGTRVEKLNPELDCVVDEKGEECRYEKLLLAIGGKPRRLPFGAGDIIYFRTLDDYYRLKELTERRGRFAVIGGGFIGSEIAAALRMNGKDVLMLFPEDGIGGRVYPRDLSLHLNAYFREKGVTIATNSTVSMVEKRDGHFIVRYQTSPDNVDREEIVDGVIAGIGLEPHIELARPAGLEIENGIAVDSQLLTRFRNIYAAGDCASIYYPALGMRMRFEHEDNALTTGQFAGRAMAGANDAYDHLPYFYTDLFDLGYEAIGDLNPSYEVVSDWQDTFRTGVLYYMQGGRVRGVMLWNIWGKIDVARELITSQSVFTPDQLIKRIT